MKDKTALMNLLAIYQGKRKDIERIEARAALSSYDNYLAIASLTDRIKYLISFIKTLP
jgi:hypothetical protein